ncbi:MAG: ATP-binding protein [Solobacterium sp.]|nr:ATP-binding protein [Solobacterium sp.]
MSTVLHEHYEVKPDDFANAGKASSAIKEQLKSLGLSPAVLRRVAVATYECEINLIIHANGGTIDMDIEEDGTIRLVFQDTGPGIADLEKAMTPGFSTASEKARAMGFGAGMGLPNIKRVSDTFDIQSSEEGTRIELTFVES